MTRYSLVVLKVSLNIKQTMCIYSLTDYMLLVSVIETFIATVTEGSPLGIAGVGPVAHEKK